MWINRKSDIEILNKNYQKYISEISTQEHIYLEFLNQKKRSYDIFINNELILKSGDLCININDFINNQRADVWQNKVNFIFELCSSETKQWYFVWIDLNNQSFKVTFPEIWFYERWFLLSLYHELGHIFGDAFFDNWRTWTKNEFIARQRALKFDHHIAKSIWSKTFLAINDFDNVIDLIKYMNHFISYSWKLSSDTKFTKEIVSQIIDDI